MSKPLSRAETAALAEDLRAILADLEAGELKGSAATRHRIEGALAALQVALGKSPRTVLGLPPTVSGEES